MEQSKQQLAYTLPEVRGIKKNAKEEGYKKGWNACKQHDIQMDKFDKMELQKVKEDYAALQAKFDTYEAALKEIDSIHQKYHDLNGDNPAANHLRNIAIEAIYKKEGDNLEKQDYAALKTIGNTLALRLRQLSRSVSVHPEYSNESEWGDYVAGAEKAIAQWEGEKVEKITDEEIKFMEECDLYPYVNNSVKVLTENDEGAWLEKNDLIRLSAILYKYVNQKEDKQ